MIKQSFLRIRVVGWFLLPRLDDHIRYISLKNFYYLMMMMIDDNCHVIQLKIVEIVLLLMMIMMMMMDQFIKWSICKSMKSKYH